MLVIKMKHQSVVEYIDYVAIENGLYIVMEYMNGGDICQLIKETTNDVEIFGIFTQIMIGVNHLHRNNIAHRDIKPENFFVKNDQNGKPRIKIGDFGLAQ